ncbi:MAG: hypothetical protein WEC12_02425 [Balneolaceae bacterium]
MGKPIESYKIGRIEVTIGETDKPEKLKVDCHDGTYHSEFTVSRYEYTYYKRHMNQKITSAYKSAYGKDDET